MVSFGSVTYYLEGVRKEFFWRELDSITAGQRMNPEFGRTTLYFGNLQNIFGGRKTGNHFSIFLYRPLFLVPGIGILAKGTVSAQGSGLMVTCRTWPKPPAAAAVACYSDS